jgi:hypothetical protein
MMEKMVEYCVHKYLGINHISREEAKKYNTSFVKVKSDRLLLNIHRKKRMLEFLAMTNFDEN